MECFLFLSLVLLAASWICIFRLGSTLDVICTPHPLAVGNGMGEIPAVVKEASDCVDTSMRTCSFHKSRRMMRAWTRSCRNDAGGSNATHRDGGKHGHRTAPRRTASWWIAGTALTATVVAGGAAYAYNDSRKSTLYDKNRAADRSYVDGDAHGQALRGWEDRWKEGRTAFHMETVHPKLIAHVDDLLGRDPKEQETSERKHPRVLVPLCGKTKDMTWLAVQGCDVFGVEIAPLAVDQFFQENGLPRTVQSVGRKGIKRVHTSGNIAILEGDLLALKNLSTLDETKTQWPRTDTLALHMGKHGQGASTMDAVWDRGAMVAVEPELRDAYADVIQNVMKSKGKMLLMALQYGKEPEGEKAETIARQYGPPYSLSYQQVKYLFKKRGFTVQVLESVDTSSSMPPRFLQDRVQVTSVLMLLEKR